MYDFFIALEYIAIIVSFYEIFIIVSRRPSDLAKQLLLVLCATVVNSVGYLIEMQAKSRETALAAVKFIYVGKPYILMAVLLFSMDYYKVRLNKVLKYVVFAFHVSISLLVLTCENNSLFYTSIEFVETGIFPHLVMEHGIMYYVNVAAIFGYLSYVIVLGIVRYKKMNSAAERKCTIILIIIMAESLVGLILFFSGITKGYDTTAISYFIGTVLLLICVLKYDMLEPVAAAKDIVVDELAQGIMVVGNENQIIYKNKPFDKIFETLEETETSVNRIEHIKENIIKHYDADERLLVGDNIYVIDRQAIVTKENNYGNMYIINDITASVNYETALKGQIEIAENANKAKSDFLARMSHEIRTPINSIMGMNEMILRKSKENDTRKYAMDIKGATSLLLSIINEILDSSKIESGKMEIRNISYDISNIINDLYNMVKVKAEQKSLELIFDISPDIPTEYIGDDVRIRQIITNLLSNAVKYTETGTVKLTVNGERHEDTEILYFEVKDTGIGIRPEDMSKLFADFERIEDTRTHYVEGTGLGMGITIRLLKLMGSELKVESGYNVGSTFYFTLRQKIVNDECLGDFTVRLKNTAENYNFVQKYRTKNAQILVVDDNSINRKIIANYLDETGIVVDEASSGTEAITKIYTNSYDIIFMDHMMPEMDGIQAFHIIREGGLCDSTPIVMLTANAITGAREQYLKEGIDDYLSKPIIPEKLDDIVIKYMPDYKLEFIEGDDSVDAVKISEIGLPELEEFDWNYAMTIAQNENLLMNMLYDFLNLMMRLPSKLQFYFDTVKNGADDEFLENMIRSYQIEVHGLKSSAASVGALLLSKTARLLEIATEEYDIDKLFKLHGILLDEINKHKHRLAGMLGRKTDEEIQNEEKIFNLEDELNSLKEAIGEGEYNRAEKVIEKILHIKFEPELDLKLNEMADAVYNFEFDEALDIIGEILNV